jgi:hypothetical protein
MNKKYPSHFILFLLVFITVLYTEKSFSQNTKINIDKKSILIGEQINFEIFVQHTSNEKVVFNIPDSIPHFEIIDTNSSDTTRDDGLTIAKQKIVFTSFDSGAYFFPSIAYNVNGTKGNIDSFKINIGYMPTEADAKPRDIKTIIEVSYFDWMWILVITACLVALGISFFLYKKINSKKLAFDGRDRFGAYKEAMLSLEKLEKENNENRLPVKEYHTQLANLFKNYCSRIMHQNVFNSTTKEVLEKLKQYELNATTSQQTLNALQTGDAAKFAKYDPTLEENEAAFNFIKDAINNIQQSKNKIL